MNIEMLQRKIKTLEGQNMPKQSVAEFTQLVGFIDRALNEAMKQDAGEKVNTLFNALFSMRDFMKTSLSQDGYRQLLLAEINAALNYVEPEVEPEDTLEPKKSLDLEQE